MRRDPFVAGVLATTILWFLVGVSRGQESVFAPLPAAYDVGPLQRWTVTIRNPTPQPITVTGAWVFAKAMAANISPATHAALQQAIDEARSLRWYRNLLIGLELSAYATTALMAGDAVKITERTRALIPAAGAVLRGVQIAAERAKPSAEAQADLLPGVFQVPAEGVVAYSMFGSTLPARR